MTSMPASRRARAMTLAPRSCPSSPGLAMTTRIRRMVTSEACAFRRAVLPTNRCGGVLAASREPEGAGRPSHHRHFFVFAPHVAECVAHLAHGGVGADRLEDRLHRVARPGADVAQPVERARDVAVVA